MVFGRAHGRRTLALPGSVTPGAPLTSHAHAGTELALVLTAEAASGTHLVARLTGPQPQMPWHTPITTAYGHPLGITVRIHAEADGTPVTRPQPLTVTPLPIHLAVLDALGAHGCRFTRTDLRPAQRITFTAPPGTRPPGTQLPQLSLTLTATPDGLDLALEPGWGLPATHHTLPHTPADLIPTVGDWLHTALARLPQVTAPDPILSRPLYAYSGHTPTTPPPAGRTAAQRFLGTLLPPALTR